MADLSLPRPLLDEVAGDLVARATGLPMADPRPLAVIFDMDGTLHDVSSVRHYLARDKGEKDFDAFHDAAASCPSHPDVEAAARACKAQGLAVFIVTARKRKHAMSTLLWLSELPAGPLEHDALLMRADGDNRRDYLVKAELLARIEATHRVVHAWDDNPAVIALWREHGITTTVVPGWKTHDAEVAAAFAAVAEEARRGHVA